jgi:HK97 family phage major capsid protein
MSTLKEQLEATEAELRTIHDIAGDEQLTDEQQARWDELTTERADLTAKIERDDARRAEVRSLAARPGNTEDGDGARGAPEVMRRVEPFDGSDIRSLTRHEARDKALKALESRDLTGHLEERQQIHMEKLLRKWSRDTDGSYIARRLLLTENRHYQSAFVKMVTRTQPVLTYEEQQAMEAYDEFRAMSIGTDSAGGFGVPVLIDPTIILTAQGSPNDILRISRVETITNDEWKGVTSAGVSWSFDPEAGEVSDDSPTLAQPAVPTYKAQGFIPYSIEVGMDYPNFASEMSVLLSEGYSELVAEKLTVGSGTNEPTGVVTKLDATVASEVAVTTDGAFGSVDVYKLWDALPIKYRNRAPSWMSSTDVMNEVRQFAAGSSNSDANFSVNITQESIPRLFGKPYYENDFMADFTATTGAANLLIVGDFSNYLVAQRAGMSVELVPHLLGSNRRPSGQRGWYAWARVGADVINTAGFRLLQNT